MIERGGGGHRPAPHRLSPKAQALVNRVNATNHALGQGGSLGAFMARLAAIGAPPRSAGPPTVLHYDRTPGVAHYGGLTAAQQKIIQSTPGASWKRQANGDWVRTGGGTEKVSHPGGFSHDPMRDPQLEQKGMLGYGLARHIVSGALAPFDPRDAARLNGPHAQQAGFAPISGLGIAGKAISEIANAALGTPAGLVETGMHPERTGKAMGHAVVGDVQHPLRHPGYSALDLYALLSAGVGAGSRIAAGAGELGAEGSLASRAGSAAAAVARKPAPVERSLTYKPPGAEGLTVHPLGSENALTGLIQKATDKTLQKALDDPKSLLHGHALRRVGNELGQVDRQHDMIAATPAMRAKAAGAKLKQHEQLLLTAYHEGIHPADLATKHWEWAAGSKDPLVRRQNETQAVLADKAAALISEHGPGWVKLPPEQALPVKLQNAYRLGHEAGLAREAILRDAGKPVSGERVHGPARIVAGADYVKPTPGRLGVESQAVLKSRARVARLENLAARAEARVRKGAAGAVDKSLSVQDRIAQLEEPFQKVVDQIHERMFSPKQTIEDAAQQRRRNVINGKLASGPGSKGYARAVKDSANQPLGKVADENRRVAEQAALKHLEASQHPLARKALDQLAMAQELRDHLDSLDPFDPSVQPKAPKGGRLELAPGGKTAFGEHGRVVTPSGHANMERLNAALSVERERLAALEQAAAKRVAPTGIVGGDDVRTGRGYVPHTQQARPVRRALSLAGRKSVGIPKEPGSLTHEFTGSLLKSGARRTDFSNLMGDAHLEAQRYFGSTLRLRDRAEKAAQATPDGIPAEHAIPVRLDKLKNHPFPNLVKQAIGEHQVPLAEDELANLQHERNNFLREVFPLAGKKTVGDLGPAERAAFEKLRAEGKVGWVDKRLLGKAVDTQHVPGHLLQGVATANNAIKGGMIYLNPGHVLTRNASNLGMTVMRQGVLAPVNLVRAARLTRTLGRDDLARLDSAVQSGSYSHVLNAEDGLGTRALNAGAHAMHTLADARYRRAAFLHQAFKHGFRSTAQVSRLLNDKALNDKLVEVSRRANDDIVDYGRLGPTEKAAVRHWVFVYPWVKGSTRFAAQTIAHHPVQAVAAAQLGRQGQKFSERSLGGTPSYLDGAFGVGGKMVVPEVANPLGTPGHVALTAVGLLNGHGTSADMLGSFAPPIAQLGATLAFQRTGLGKSTLGQSLPRIVADSLEQELPAVAFGKRFTGGHNPNKLFSYSPLEAVGRLFGGAPFPRTYNPTILHQQAEKEKLAMMAPDERVKYRTGEAVKQLPAQWATLQRKHPDIAQQVGPDFVKQVASAYKRDQDRQLALLNAAKAKGVKPGHLSALDRLNVTLTVAQSYGLTADDAKQILDAEKELQMAKMPDKFRDRRYSAIASHVWKAYGLSAYKSAWQNRIAPYTTG